jgi:pimeloyl-ACP methyl ester carboxylesterase
VSVDGHTIELGGEPVFYHSAPVQGDPVLYLHGAPTSSDDWLGFLELTGGLAPDLPGFGRSGKGGHLDYSMQAMADFVERFLAYVGAGRVKLVAHDWGAVAGLVFALRAPDRIERLVLIDAVPLLDGYEWYPLARAWRTAGLGEAVMGVTGRWVFERLLRHGTVSEYAWPKRPRRLWFRPRPPELPRQRAVRQAWEQYDQGTQRAILRVHRDASPARLAAAGAGLGRLDVPALVLWGAQDPWLAPSLAQRYGDALPRASVEVIEGAGHWPWLDRPEVVERVAAFLDPARVA